MHINPHLNGHFAGKETDYLSYYHSHLRLEPFQKYQEIQTTVLTCNAAGSNGFWNTKPTGCGSAHLVGEFLSIIFCASWISLTTKSFNVVVLGLVQRLSLLPVNWMLMDDLNLPEAVAISYVSANVLYLINSVQFYSQFVSMHCDVLATRTWLRAYNYVYSPLVKFCVLFPLL